MAMSVATGTYSGNGATSGDRAITGVGFAPKIIFVWSADTDTYTGALKYTIPEYISVLSSGFSTWGENGIATLANTPNFDNIVSLDTNGFTIRCASVPAQQIYNKSGVTFYWIALGGTEVETGSYSGNNADNRDFTGLAGQAVAVTVASAAAANQHHTIKFLSSGAGTDSSSLLYNVADASNQIQQILSNGFQVGTTNHVNATGTTYFYWAIQPNSRVYQAEYTGNGTDNRSITGFGFQPNAVLIKGSGARNPAWRSSDHSGDNSKFYRSSGFVANYIQQFLSDGIEIGTAADINQSGETFRILAFRTGLDSATNSRFLMFM